MVSVVRVDAFDDAQETAVITRWRGGRGGT
jgi:hypothetical protein